MNYTIASLFGRGRKPELKAKYAKAIDLYLSNARLSEVEVAAATRLKRVTFNSFVKRTLRPLISYEIRFIDPHDLGLEARCFHIHPKSSLFDECKAFLMSSELVRMLWTTPGDQLMAFVVGEHDDLHDFKREVRRFDGVMEATPIDLAKLTQPIPPSMLTRYAQAHK